MALELSDNIIILITVQWFIKAPVKAVTQPSSLASLYITDTLLLFSTAQQKLFSPTAENGNSPLTTAIKNQAIKIHRQSNQDMIASHEASVKSVLGEHFLKFNTTFFFTTWCIIHHPEYLMCGVLVQIQLRNILKNKNVLYNKTWGTVA